MDREHKWHEAKFKGNHAENSARYLINSMPNWKCIGFGVEHHIKDLRKLARNTYNQVTEKIRYMPDFVAFNSKTEETLFIEVKFRSKKIHPTNGKPEYPINFLEKYKEYWKGTKLLIFQNCEPYIFVVDLDKIGPNIKRLDLKGPHWNFEDIQQDIQDIFPELEEEIIKKISQSQSSSSI
tara:strand:- start:20 stop:559 length:540 start_codon:yes stop_codon:yes gene_type:complete